MNVLTSPLTEGFLDFGCQFGKNIVIGLSIVAGMLLLIHQGNVDKGHQRNPMVGLAPTIYLGIGIVAVCYEFSCTTIVHFLFTIDDDIHVVVVDMQRDM